MKKILLICLCLLFSVHPSSGQAVKASVVKGKNYKGYIFSKKHELFFNIFKDQKARYTPSEWDVIEAEAILREKIDDFAKAKRVSPDIKRSRLGKYDRQYLGFMNNENDKIIYINLFTKKDKESSQKLREELYWVLDGGSNYWQICVNITTRELFNIHVNGEA